MAFQKVENQHTRSPLAREAGKSLMALSASRKGATFSNPAVPMVPFVARKLKESTRKGR
jgi:hypothetical protein